MPNNIEHLSNKNIIVLMQPSSDKLGKERSFYFFTGDDVVYTKNNKDNSLLRREIQVYTPHKDHLRAVSFQTELLYRILLYGIILD